MHAVHSQPSLVESRKCFFAVVFRIEDILWNREACWQHLQLHKHLCVSKTIIRWSDVLPYARYYNIEDDRTYESKHNYEKKRGFAM